MTVIKTVHLKKNQIKDSINTSVRTDQIYMPDSTRALKVELYDIDEAIKWHLENVVRFKITKNGNIVYVPVIGASPEKWVSMQQHGSMRDSSDKLLTPIVAISRTGVEYRDDYKKNEVTKTEENRWIYQRKYTAKNKYTPFSILNNVTPATEYYSVDLPRFVNIQYTLVCWTDYMQQMNELVEQLMFFNGTAFGNDYKFTTYVDAPSFELSSDPGTDHFVKATFILRTKGYILNRDTRSRPTIQKLIAPNKVVLNFHESDTINSEQFTASTKRKTTNVVTPGGAASKSEITVSIDDTVLVYLNTNISKTGVFQSDSSVILSNTQILTAPASLPATGVSSFYYFINGQNIPVSFVTSIQNYNSDVSVVFNTSALGYTISETDVIIVVGKFTN